jgi:hypothetical protein
MGFKKTSELLNIGAFLSCADGTPTQTTVNLPLSSLDREVFVVTDVSLDHSPLIEPAPGQNAQITASVNRNGDGIQYLHNPDTIAHTQFTIDVGAGGAFLTQRNSYPDESTSGTSRDFLNIIATPDFVLAGSFSTSAGGASNRNVYARITGYRAIADAATYSALVVEEAGF